ncbi:MAG: outer membrane beta-barrel protein [Pseudomonadota bacterium]
MKTVSLTLAGALMMVPAAQAQDNIFGLHIGAFEQTSDTFDLDGILNGADVDLEAELDYSVGFVVGASYDRVVYTTPAVAFLVGGEFTFRTSEFDEFDLEGEVLGDEVSIDNISISEENAHSLAFMANFTASRALDKPIRPYLTAGIGYITPTNDDLDGGGAYQIKGGVDYAVMPTTRVGIEVGYLDAFDEFEIDDDEVIGFDRVDTEIGYAGVSMLFTVKLVR